MLKMGNYNMTAKEKNKKKQYWLIYVVNLQPKLV